MDCEGFQVLLPELLYGELESERRSASQQHASSCSSCGELLGELRAVREAQVTVSPPAGLNDQIKLAMRDQLLAESAPRIHERGGLLHLVGTGILAACVCIAGFSLGRIYERNQEEEESPTAPIEATALSVPSSPAVIENEPWLEIKHSPAEGGPGNSEAWQRVLYDAARPQLRKGHFRQALEFYQRAAAMAPQGPLAAPAGVGMAEALLGLERQGEASEKLEEIRRQVIAGTIYGNAALLQRIHELSEQVERPPGE